MKSTSLSILVRLLVACYFPFIALAALFVGTVAVLLLILAVSSAWAWVLVVIALLCFLPLVQVGWVMVQLLMQKPQRDEMELRLPERQMKRLYDLVDRVGEKRNLPEPDEVRLGACTVAHVYENHKGKLILVIGGLAMATYTQKALAGTIAHELGHFGAGDTRLYRSARHCNLFMALVEAYCAYHPISYLNPLIWAILLYQLVFHIVWAAHSRQQEFAADRHEVELNGPEEAAASLILCTVPECLPWARLLTVVELCVQNGEPASRVFAEQARLVRSASRVEWDDACRKAMKERTGLFDSHPCLKDRLKAMGVKPKEALRLALDRNSPPARELIDDWNRVEAELSELLVAPYREYYLAKHEFAQIVLGRPTR